MIKVIMLMVWCAIGLMVHASNDGKPHKYNFCGKLCNTMIWVVFIYWFANK